MPRNRRRGANINANQQFGGERVVSSITNRSTGRTVVRTESGRRFEVNDATSGGTGG